MLVFRGQSRSTGHRCERPQILLLVVFVAHVDMFEHSISPPERNIKWPKTGGS